MAGSVRVWMVVGSVLQRVGSVGLGVEECVADSGGVCNCELGKCVAGSVGVCGW